MEVQGLLKQRGYDLKLVPFGVDGSEPPPEAEQPPAEPEQPPAEEPAADAEPPASGE